ncbi:hypothetical protein DNTS_009562 [Danionella cerebrum]|uniref:K Homology domain-containing protein n=1 Tax=Danionella cerebrum TaxID=2873325 RepID=A0A553N113_9TELE|nr:hypothetical protein DNTS_009562 [Danionella translucida]
MSSAPAQSERSCSFRRFDDNKKTPNPAAQPKGGDLQPSLGVYKSWKTFQKWIKDVLHIGMVLMETLRPHLIHIRGRIYRKNPVQEEYYEEEEDCSYSEAVSEQCLDEPCDAHNIEETERGFRCAVDVPSVLYKYLIGKKGETRKRLESETKTSIIIPKQGQEGAVAEDKRRQIQKVFKLVPEKETGSAGLVTGAFRASVSSAVTRLELLIESFRWKQPFTHFLSIPLTHPRVQEGFHRFQMQDFGVEESIFQNPSKLHLTVGTLVLLNQQEVMHASSLLLQCRDAIREITGANPLPIEVRGIEYMNDDPSAVDVLYAKVSAQDGSDKLQRIADALVQSFVSTGFMERSCERVKIHGTVMNTLFRKDPSAEDKGASGRSNVKSREAFDAKNILQMFGEFFFGAFELDSVHLSQRFSTDASGYYSSAGNITFTG